jgi:AraC-like DNA-binding protein
MQGLMATITLDWLHIVALLGAVQGLILAGVLAVRRRNRTANRLLAVAMLAFTIYLTTSVYHAAGLEQVFPHFFGAAYLMPLLFGPLVYLYAVTASDRTRRLTRWDAFHFAPFVLAFVACLPIYLMSGPDKIAFYQALQRGAVPLVIQVIDPLKLLSGVSYAGVTLLLLRRHRARIKDSYSSLEHVNLQWLVRLAAAGAAIWVLAVVFEVTELLHSPAFQRGDDIITLAIALLVYGIGYMALRQPEIFRFDTAEYPVVGAEPAAPPGSPTPASAVAPESVVETEPGGSRYERSGLSDWEAAALKQALLMAMDQDRPWQDSDLTLADLARRLSTTPHKLSEVLNAQLEQSFYDFVNGYRVRYVQRRIGDDDARNLTILSLALDAGFASKSTFNDVFKKHTGKTPSDYRRSVAA